MNKRYKFIAGGKTYFKNVSPNNEQKFFDLYGKYNPISIETDQSQRNQKTDKKTEHPLGKAFGETEFAKANSILAQGIKDESQREEAKRYLSNAMYNVCLLYTSDAADE